MRKGFWSEPRSIVAIAVCFLALAEIIDLTIVAVAIPHLMGALGCNIQEVSLVTTSYIVSAAVFIMLTGYVSSRFGSKKVILISSIIFGVSSILCGLATNLSSMVFFRLLQGMGGAFLPAMAQGYIGGNFNEKERPAMMSILTLTMVMGPIIGPIIGGYLVETYNWRWIFFVNVPICLIAFLVILFKMKESKTAEVHFEGISFIFMTVGFGCLEYFIDEGNNNDWFNSHKLIIILLVGLTSILFFIWRGLLGKSVVSFKVFTNLNFILCCFYTFVFKGLISVSLAFYPTLMQDGYGFPVDLAGFITAPRGIFAILGALIATRLCKKYDKRLVLYIGIVLFSGATCLESNFGTNWNLWSQLASSALIGFAMSTTFVVILQVVFIGINQSLSNDAAGVFNFFRNIGSSVGTSLASTIISQQQQVSWNDMISHLNPFNPVLQQVQNSIPNNLPLNGQIQILSEMVQTQAFLLANIDVFHFVSVAVLILAIIPPFLTKPERGITKTHV